MKNPFLKYVVKEEKDNIFHSSAYGKAQNEGAIGTASTESFEDRLKVEHNRKVVRGYNDSQIVNAAYANGPKAKQYTPSDKCDTRLTVSEVEGSSANNANLARDRMTGTAIKTSTNKTLMEKTPIDKMPMRKVPNLNASAAPAKRSFVPPVKPKFGI